MDAQAERIVAACRESGAREVRAAADEAERQLLWKGRKSAFGAYGRDLARLHGDGRRHPAHASCPTCWRA